MKKDRIVYSLVIIGCFLVPGLLDIQQETHSYPSDYPVGLHERMIWDALNCISLDADNKTSNFYLCREEIVALSTNYLDQLYLAQDGYDSSLLRKWDHFWDPFTLTGLYANIGAPTHAEDFFFEAVNYYHGYGLYPVDKDQAYYLLGHAIHLVQDLTVPYHAQNDPFNMHVEYESFADSQHKYGLLAIPTTGEYNTQKDWTGEHNIKGWVHQAALVAAPYRDVLENDTSYDNWHDIAEELIGLSIQFTAGLIFQFWQYVHNIDFDGDGISAVMEYDLRTNHASNDTDLDLISDNEEIVLGVDGFITNPAREDTDSDGYNDYEEIYTHFTDPTNNKDSPYYFVPLVARNFKGLSNLVSTITFTWNNPENYLSGWYYQLFKFEGGNEYLLYNGTIRIYEFTPPDFDHYYSYRLYCYRNNYTKGMYVQWSCSVTGNNVATEIQD